MFCILKSYIKLFGVKPHLHNLLFILTFKTLLENLIVISKIDNSKHTVLTNLIIFSNQTAINRYKNLKKNTYVNKNPNKSLHLDHQN